METLRPPNAGFDVDLNDQLPLPPPPPNTPTAAGVTNFSAGIPLFGFNIWDPESCSLAPSISSTSIPPSPSPGHLRIFTSDLPNVIIHPVDAPAYIAFDAATESLEPEFMRERSSSLSDGGDSDDGMGGASRAYDPYELQLVREGNQRDWIGIAGKLKELKEASKDVPVFSRESLSRDRDGDGGVVMPLRKFASSVNSSDTSLDSATCVGSTTSVSMSIGSHLNRASRSTATLSSLKTQSSEWSTLKDDSPSASSKDLDLNASLIVSSELKVTHQPIVKPVCPTPASGPTRWVSKLGFRSKRQRSVSMCPAASTTPTSAKKDDTSTTTTHKRTRRSVSVQIPPTSSSSIIEALDMDVEPSVSLLLQAPQPAFDVEWDDRPGLSPIPEHRVSFAPSVKETTAKRARPMSPPPPLELELESPLCSDDSSSAATSPTSPTSPISPGESESSMDSGLAPPSPTLDSPSLLPLSPAPSTLSRRSATRKPLPALPRNEVEVEIGVEFHSEPSTPSDSSGFESDYTPLSSPSTHDPFSIRSPKGGVPVYKGSILAKQVCVVIPSRHERIQASSASSSPSHSSYSLRSPPSYHSRSSSKSSSSSPRSEQFLSRVEKATQPAPVDTTPHECTDDEFIIPMFGFGFSERESAELMKDVLKPSPYSCSDPSSSSSPSALPLGLKSDGPPSPGLLVRSASTATIKADRSPARVRSTRRVVARSSSVSQRRKKARELPELRLGEPFWVAIGEE